MTKTITCALAICMTISFSSCKKKATEVNPDYIGSWTAFDSEQSYSLSIQSNSKASYSRYKGALTTNVSGNARNSGDTFKVFTKKFKLDQKPVEDSEYPGHFTMILDGIVFSR